MSLVIALAASREAVIGADRRAIAFLGSCPGLEEELYSGQIENDGKLADRARELGASLQICDGREKVWRRGELLVGEVTEISPTLCRRRRIYLTPGASLQVDITGGEDSERMPAGKGKVQAARPGSGPGAAWAARSLATGSPRSWPRRRSPGPADGSARPSSRASWKKRACKRLR